MLEEWFFEAVEDWFWSLDTLEQERVVARLEGRPAPSQNAGE